MGERVCARCGKPTDRCLCDVRLVARDLGATVYRLEPEEVLLILVPLERALDRDGAPPGFPVLVTYCVEAVVEGSSVFDQPVGPDAVGDELLYRMGPSPNRQRIAGVIAELLAGARPPSTD